MGALVRFTGPIPRRIVQPVNACVLALRSSPRWGRALRRHLTVVTYTGRRSGQVFTTPVAYRRSGSTVTIPVAIPERKQWWRNFTGGGGPLSLELAEGQRTGHAVAAVDDRGGVVLTVRLGDGDAAGH
jgi:hypothetical protein